MSDSRVERRPYVAQFVALNEKRADLYARSALVKARWGRGWVGDRHRT
jgi:hypothetical protein